jgi:hypothetical protein
VIPLSRPFIGEDEGLNSWDGSKSGVSVGMQVLRLVRN